MSKSKLGSIIEVARIIFIIVGVNIGYWPWVDPSLRMEIMTAVLILSLNGTVAFGLLVLGESASERIGYQADPAFQRQSGMNNLAMVLALIIIFILRWNVFAYLALLIACLVFFFLFFSESHLELAERREQKDCQCHAPVPNASIDPRGCSGYCSGITKYALIQATGYNFEQHHE